MSAASEGRRAAAVGKRAPGDADRRDLERELRRMALLHRRDLRRRRRKTL